MSTYEDKRAELRAVAEGGSDGRAAYKEGRQRLVSDQRAAIDAALSGPVRFGEGTASALDAIVRPVGDTARARLDVAGERHGSSMGALDAALSGALGQQAGARQMNYNQTLADARQATDRNIEMSEISRRKQAEEQARREAEAAARRGGFDDYTEAEIKKIAEMFGGEAWQGDLDATKAYQGPEFKRELSRISGQAFSHIRDPKERQALLQKVLDLGSAGDTEGVLSLVDQYAPRSKFDGFNSAFNGLVNTIRGGSGLDPATTAAQRRAAAIDAILGDLASLRERQGQEYRSIEADRNLYNRDAYAEITGDPLLAAALYPQTFSKAESAMDNTMDLENYILEGATGTDLTRMQDRENEEMLNTLASGAGLSTRVMNTTLDELPVDPTNVYKMLEDSGVASTIAEAVEGAVRSARGAAPGMGSKATLAATAAADFVRNELEGDPEYIEALALIAAEQARVYAKGN